VIQAKFFATVADLGLLFEGVVGEGIKKQKKPIFRGWIL